MKGRLLVLRPEPGATATAETARAIGLEAIKTPLFRVHPLPWALPDGRPDAVLMTSANAARHGGKPLAALRALPLYAVGKATEAAARDAGFTTITAGSGTVEDILAEAQADGIETLLHLAGREHRPAELPALTIDRRLVYASDAVTALPEAAHAALPHAIALLHSPRAAALFAALVKPAGIAVAAISPATLAAAGPGWRATAVAERPDDASLLAAAAKLCDQSF